MHRPRADPFQSAHRGIAAGPQGEEPGARPVAFPKPGICAPCRCENLDPMSVHFLVETSPDKTPRLVRHWSVNYGSTLRITPKGGMRSSFDRENFHPTSADFAVATSAAPMPRSAIASMSHG